jgi:hypothetical protein
LIGVGIHRGKCNLGQVRVGLGAAADFAVELGSPKHPGASNVAFGVDVDANSCSVSGPCSGATDPVLVSLASDNQALAVWLTPRDCMQSGGSSQVTGLGLLVAGDQLNGTRDGHGLAMGDSAGSGAPALAAFSGLAEDGGYFLAYAGVDRIELRFIAQLSGEQSLDADPLSGSLDVENVDHVALALSAEPSVAAHGLAVAFSAGSAAARSISVAAVAFDRERAPHFASNLEPLTFVAKNAVTAGPFLEYSPTGFAVEADAQAQGGWLLMWMEREPAEGPDGQRLMAARVAERGMRALGQPVELARGSIRKAFTYLKPRRGADPALRYGYVTNDKLSIGQLTCADRD